MNAVDKKRAKLHAIGEELRKGHRTGACGRRGCDCLRKYERTREQYLRLLDDHDERAARGADRRRGRA